ncbi:molecular chaperone GrpE [Actinoplanes sp. NPDC023714]|uniref:molecular chaperone GrpE n=1 Tax=Actinoplanes sp. NPDC023714 TaxID=3154322 RepID=UPI0033E50086
MSDEDDDPIAGTLASISESLDAFHRRSERREAVIDRLHEENQVLRTGLTRTILQPVLTDLARLYDGLAQQAERLAGDPDRAADQQLWAGFADDVAQALARYGTDVVTAEPGEAYERGRHVVAGFVDNPDPAADRTVACTLAVGLVDQETGAVRRPVRVRLFREPAVVLGAGTAD